MELKTKAKYVSNWWLQKLPNGIYNLTINTTEKWLAFHAYNDHMFIIGSEEDESQEEWEDKQLIIPEFLPQIKNVTYIQTIQQNKDQIGVFWIPYYHKWVIENKEELIDEMKNYEQ